MYLCYQPVDAFYVVQKLCKASYVNLAIISVHGKEKYAPCDYDAIIQLPGLHSHRSYCAIN